MDITQHIATATSLPNWVPIPAQIYLAHTHAGLPIRAAMADLGPGLSDVLMRCCCYLEGVEAAKKRLGWSARSGKIVLRIALMRLHQHYERTLGSAAGGMIG